MDSSTSNLVINEICGPIKTLTELEECLESPPKWVKKVVPLRMRSQTVVENTNFSCHYTEGNWNLQKRVDAYLVPKTLVCHDMKNGYLDDKYVNVIDKGNGYTFYRWPQIDIFVYFSHHFITIPPLHWINNAHNNGVKILGTLITEWDDGENLCKTFLKDLTTMQQFVSKLVDITILYNFDGWLLNFENKFDNTSILLEFVKNLTENLHNKKQGSIVIWYDSVIMNGNLKWQNELNENNRPFFDMCDGIFLNYTWKEENLHNTSKAAQHRITDVYVGIDVFGRNTFGGGNFNSYIAAEEIRKLNMSMAIFAQGWTHETLNPNPPENFYERFIERDNAFWRSLWPYLYTHPVNTLFETFFYIGADKYKYSLEDQQLSLSRFLHSNARNEYDSSVPTLKNQCNCLSLHMDNHKTACLININSNNLRYVHHLFVCDIILQHDILLYTFTKPVPGEKNDYLNIIVLLQENGSFRKIVCNCINKPSKNDNYSLQNIYPKENTLLNFEQIDYIPSDTTLRTFLIKLNVASRIIDISAQLENGKSVILCGIGLQKYLK